MHRALNSIASIAACADTLIEAEGRLDPRTRRLLLEVISSQAGVLRSEVAGHDGEGASTTIDLVGAMQRKPA